jgi:hypothetical protein
MSSPIPHWEGEVRSNLRGIGWAIRAYHADHGMPPDSLRRLEPAYLGILDLWVENHPGRWATDYERGSRKEWAVRQTYFPANATFRIDQTGEIKREE